MKFTNEKTRKFTVKLLWSGNKKGLYLFGVTLPEIGDCEVTCYINDFVLKDFNLIWANKYEISLQYIIGYELTLKNKELNIEHKCSINELMEILQ